MWKRGKWIADDAEMNIDLVDTSPMRDRVPLNKLRRREASKIIGVWIEPDGNKKKLIQVLQKSAVEWGTEVRKVNGSQQDIKQALHLTVSTQLKYPLCAFTLTKNSSSQLRFL